MQFKSAYDSHDAASRETGLECKDPSLAIQSQKDDADINVILERFGITGELPQTLRLPEYGDYEDIFDFQSAMNATIEAQKTFMSLPAKIRSRFENDPQQFLEFVTAEEDGKLKNLEELRKLGLAKEAPVPVADKAGETPKA